MHLNINVISDFHSRKTTPFYDPQDYSKSIAGMKIIPLQISELKKIVSNRKTYKELYSLFETTFIRHCHLIYGTKLLLQIICELLKIVKRNK